MTQHQNPNPNRPTPEEASKLTPFQTAYLSLAKAIQTGIEHLRGYVPSLTDAKHLRVGIEMGKCEREALLATLYRKGVFTPEEYQAILLEQMELSKAEYEADLSDRMNGAKIKLH